MTAAFDPLLGGSVSRYAQQVIRECDLRHPPIHEDTIADYLDLGIEEFTLDGYPESEGMRTVIDDCPSWLQTKPGERPRIRLYDQLHRRRRRTSIFHEFGHHILPWHGGTHVLRPVDPLIRRREQEAFHCGYELLMPRASFVEDALSSQISIRAIDELSRRYNTSIEATAIWYARTHPGICAILVLDSFVSTRSTGSEQARRNRVREGSPHLPMELPGRMDRVRRSPPHPLRVKYFAKSKRFRTFVYPRTRFAEESAAFQALTRNREVHDEFPALALGSREQHVYQATFRRLGNTEKVLGLLWYPDPQLNFRLEMGRSR